MIPRGALLLTTVLLGACAGLGERADPWPSIELSTEPVTRPHNLPQLPTAEIVDGAVRFGPEAFAELSQYREIAEANTEIATLHAQQIDALRRAIAELTAAGQAEHELAELRQVLLEEERRARLWDKLLYGGMAVLGLAVGLH